jgi:hypothetical protein
VLPSTISPHIATQIVESHGHHPHDHAIPFAFDFAVHVVDHERQTNDIGRAEGRTASTQ